MQERGGLRALSLRVSVGWFRRRIECLNRGVLIRNFCPLKPLNLAIESAETDILRHSPEDVPNSTPPRLLRGSDRCRLALRRC